MMRNIIKVTDSALAQLRNILHKTNNNAIRLGIKSGGCNGFEYTLIPIKEQQGDHDEIVKFEKLEVHICSKSIMYLLGTTIDWKKDIMGQSFTFDNPAAKNSCGCGSSFNPL